MLIPCTCFFMLCLPRCIRVVTVPSDSCPNASPSPTFLIIQSTTRLLPTIPTRITHACRTSSTSGASFRQIALASDQYFSCVALPFDEATKVETGFSSQWLMKLPGVVSLTVAYKKFRAPFSDVHDSQFIMAAIVGPISSRNPDLHSPIEKSVVRIHCRDMAAYLDWHC